VKTGYLVAGSRTFCPTSALSAYQIFSRQSSTDSRRRGSTKRLARSFTPSERTVETGPRVISAALRDSMFLSIPQPATHLRVFFSIILYTGVVIAREAMSPAFQRVMSLASSIVSIVRECQRLVRRPPWTLQSSPLPSLLPRADDREASVESAPTLLEVTFCIWQ